MWIEYAWPCRTRASIVDIVCDPSTPSNKTTRLNVQGVVIRLSYNFYGNSISACLFFPLIFFPFHLHTLENDQNNPISMRCCSFVAIVKLYKGNDIELYVFPNHFRTWWLKRWRTSNNKFPNSMANVSIIRNRSFKSFMEILLYTKVCTFYFVLSVYISKLFAIAVESLQSNRENWSLSISCSTMYIISLK